MKKIFIILAMATMSLMAMEATTTSMEKRSEAIVRADGHINFETTDCIIPLEYVLDTTANWSTIKKSNLEAEIVANKQVAIIEQNRGDA